MINIKEQDTINEYARLKGEIKMLEAKIDEINPQVLEIMQTNEVEEIAIGELGKLTMASRRTWKYSEKVKQLDETLKEQKKLEERTGLADYSEKHYIVFKGSKDNENNY